MSSGQSRVWGFAKAIPLLVVLLVAAVAVVLGLWFSAREVVRFVGSLESELTASIVAAAGAVLVGLATVIYNQRQIKEREIAESHRPQKVEVYGRYMEMMFDLLKRTKEGQTASKEQMPEALVDKMYEFRRDVILWGSPGVIRAYLDWEKIASEDPTTGFLAWDKMLREFRKDLGNSNWLLKDGQLMSVILTQKAREKMNV